MNKYILQKSSTRPNGWVLTDRENGIVITFDEGLFNESQNVTPLEDVSHTPQELARIVREMGEWVARHHGAICFKETFVFEFSEDESELHLVRTKAPRWRLVLNRGEFDNIKLATSLRKAAEFLTKKVR
nr:MAG TPA: hypothetical protein [Caudoviricetes sp.]